MGSYRIRERIKRPRGQDEAFGTSLRCPAPTRLLSSSGPQYAFTPPKSNHIKVQGISDATKQSYQGTTILTIPKSKKKSKVQQAGYVPENSDK